jgi:hypothetical protein
MTDELTVEYLDGDGKLPMLVKWKNGMYAILYDSSGPDGDDDETG